MAQESGQHPVNRRPKDDTSPLEEKKIDISQRGNATIETEDGTHLYAVWETIVDTGYFVVTRGINVADQSECQLKFWKRAPKLKNNKENFNKINNTIAKMMAREVAVLKKLKKQKVKPENIISVLYHCDHADFPEPDGSTTDSVLLVLESPRHYTLEQYICVTGAFNHRLARTYFEQILRGLEALHADYYAHRDLKPANMIIDENYTLKLVSFGFSKEYYDDEKKEHIHETAADFGFLEDSPPEYRSPEMNMALANEKMNFCGNDCDIFALGVTLFNLCIRARKESALHDYGQIARPFRIADAELFSIHDSKDQHWYYLLQNGVTLDQKGVQRRVSPADMRQKFWSQHVPKVDFDVKYPQLADLLIGMMHPFAASRYNIANVRQHNWLTQGEQLDKAELKKEMDARRITLRTHI